MSRLVFIYSSPVSTRARALPLNITGIGITGARRRVPAKLARVSFTSVSFVRFYRAEKLS